MHVSTAVRLLPAVPVIGVMIIATGLWRSPTPSTYGLERPSSYDTLLLQLDSTPPGEDIRWGAETMGLMLALLEGGLSTIEGVTARVDRIPVAPGLDVAVAPNSYWTASVQLVQTDDDTVRAELTLCDPLSACRPLLAEGAREDVDQLARSLIERVAIVLGRPTQDGPTWARRQSDDNYAQLMAGRSAAVWYGLMEAPPDDALGDVRRDPVARALYLDPDMPVARWIAARRALQLGDPDGAERALRVGAEVLPHPLLEVGHAAVLLEMGAAEASLVRWRALREDRQRDPRLEMGEIDALIGSGRVTEARKRLDRLPDRLQDTPRGLSLRVAVEEASGRPSSPDGLLARWQERAPDDPLPVRRRIQALVDLGRFEDALALTDELKRRGAGQEAQQLEVALAAELGRWEQAVTAANTTDPGLATAIRQIVGSDSGPVVSDATPPLRDAVVLHRAERLLAEGDTDAALSLTEGLLSRDPHHLGAHTLRVEILQSTTDERAKLAARCALREVHPGATGDPASAEAIALARRCDR